MGELVAKLMRMQPADPRLGTPPPNDRPDTGVGDPASLSEPQVGKVGSGMAGTRSEVAIQGDGRFLTEWGRARTSALSHGDRHRGVEVDV